MSAPRTGRRAALAALLGGLALGPAAAAAGGSATASGSAPAAGSAFQAAGVPMAPTMTEAGPYGSPFQLGPAAGGIALPWVASLTLGGSELRAPPGGSLQRSRIAPGDSAIEPDEDDDPDDDRPVRPGTLTLNPVKIPTFDYRVQAKPVAPHLTPDVTYDLDSRTTIGLFSDGTKVEAKPGTGFGSLLGMRGGTPAADSKIGTGTLPSFKARDIGAGITLQYRFGQ